MTRAEATKAYCKYAPVSLGPLRPSALIDSGNTARTAMCYDSFLRLGLNSNDLQPLPELRIATAKTQEELSVMGQTRHKLHLHFGNIPVRFAVRPVVIRDLSMPLNISGPFLKQHNIDQLHSKNALLIQSHLLHLHVTPLPSPEVASSPALVRRRTIIPAMGAAFVPLSVPAIPAGDMPPGGGVVEGGGAVRAHIASMDLPKEEDDEASGTEDEEDGLVPAAAALVAIGNDGKGTSSALNPSSYDLVLEEGTKFGDYIALCTDAAEPTMAPWRVTYLGEEDRRRHQERIAAAIPKEGNGPTLREKLKEAIRKAKRSREAAADKEDFLDIQRLSDTDLRVWIWDNFQLDSLPCLRTPADRRKAEDLLVEFKEVLAVGGEYGSTNLVEHEIRTGSAPPIHCRHRPLNPSLEGDLKGQIKKWLHHKVIEPSTSPWSFPLVAAPKKGGRIRWCIDYRKLNNITERDSHSIPNISDNLCRLAHSKVFSTLDANGAFHVVQLRKEDRPKTSFSTPFGSYQFRTLPFGLSNGPARNCRLVTLVLNGVPPTVAIPNLDDTLVHSPDVPTHFRSLRTVFAAYRKAGLKLQPDKCKMFQSEVEYLGHLVGADGVKPVPSYLDVVKDWKMPTTKTEVRVFLGKCGYYRRFVKGYSGIAKPLSELKWLGRRRECLTGSHWRSPRQ